MEKQIKHADKKRIENWIDGMNSFNSTPEYGTTRVLFTEPEIKNREYVKKEMKKLGLTVTEDAIGNIFATLLGSEPDKPPVWTGSHIDTVLNAGKFDGMAGVVCGMEALYLIKESGLVHKRNLTVVVYTSEEPTRFGLSCLGSRAMAGELTLEDTKKLQDKDGKSLYRVLEELNYNLSNFSKVRKQINDVYAAVELHIEQNNRMEKNRQSIGIVKKICAPSNYSVEINGCQSHAGGTDMTDRKDAFAAGCEMALLLEKLARDCPSEYNTATIGRVEVFPGAINVIPGLMRFSVDIRDCNMDTKQKLIEEWKKGSEAIAKKRCVEVTITEENNDVPLTCDENIVEKLCTICEEKHLPYGFHISGPYHDTLFVGRFTKAAMIFVPSKNGISHSPKEWTDYEELADGTDVLAKILLQLANEPDEI